MLPYIAGETNMLLRPQRLYFGLLGLSRRNYVHRWTVSELLRPSKLLPFGQSQSQKKAEKNESEEVGNGTRTVSKSARLLADQGVVRPVADCPGLFNILPLGLRSIEKLNKLIDTSMREIRCQKVHLPILTSGDLWQKTERWNEMGKELVKLKDRSDKDYVLSPTHEEAMTTLVADMFPISYKDLPLRLYQNTMKYRDEMQPKFGLLRSREFLMKDLYTFDQDLQGAKVTYDLVGDCYDRFFRKLGVPYYKVIGDTGAIGGKKSHEYHFPSEIGEDTIQICPKYDIGKNAAVTESIASCCDQELTTINAIEVGHAFLLGDKYSKILHAKYLNDKGKPEVLQMGCYGLGVTRILAASLEVLSSEKELRWPPLIVPFSVAILAPKFGSKEYQAYEKVLQLHDMLNEQYPDDIIIDDRGDVTVGKKLRESFKVGYRFLVLFGKDCVNPENSLVEVYDVNNSKMFKMSVEAALEFLKSQK